MLTAETPAGPRWDRTARSDLELCGSCGGGSRAAFSEVVMRYRAPLLAYCGRLVGSDHAEDVLQHTLLKAWLALAERGAEVTNLRAWLYRIAHNEAMDHLRKAGAPWDELDCEWESPESTERAVEATERLGRVSDGIRELPTRQREALLMHSVKGDSYADIAVQLETNVPAVSQLITRARARLREIPALVPPWLLVRRLTGAARRATAGLSGTTKAAVLAVTVATGTAVPLVVETADRPSPETQPALLGGGTSTASAQASGPSDARARGRKRSSRRVRAAGAGPGTIHTGALSRPAPGSPSAPGPPEAHGSAPAKSETGGGPTSGSRVDSTGSRPGGGSGTEVPPVSGGASISVQVPGVGSVGLDSSATTGTVRLPAGVPVALPSISPLH